MNGGPKENANPIIHSISQGNRNVGENIEFSQSIQVALEHAGSSFLQSMMNPQPRSIFPITFAASSVKSSDESKLPKQEIPRDPIDTSEIFEHIRGIQDPEHPLTLEQLGVVSLPQIQVDQSASSTKVHVRFTPTIPHCSMATLIGLTLTVQLRRCLPRTYKVMVEIEPGTHQSELSINEQLADKERVCAALENQHLLGIVNKCIAAKDIEQ